MSKAKKKPHLFRLGSISAAELAWRPSELQNVDWPQTSDIGFSAKRRTAFLVGQLLICLLGGSWKLCFPISRPRSSQPLDSRDLLDGKSLSASDQIVGTAIWSHNPSLIDFLRSVSGGVTFRDAAGSHSDVVLCISIEAGQARPPAEMVRRRTLKKLTAKPAQACYSTNHLKILNKTGSTASQVSSF